MILFNHTSKLGKDIKFLVIRDSHLNGHPNTQNITTFEDYTVSEVSDVSYVRILFDESIKTFDITIDSDAEIIDDTGFETIIPFHFLELSENKIKTIHKDSFREFVDLESLLLDSNLLETLDDNTFAYNSKLKLLSLNNNKLKRLSTQLFSRNTKLAYLLLQDNEINQIEEGFYFNLVKMMRLNLQANPCTKINFVMNFAELTKYNQINLELCYLNFKTWKETSNDFKTIESQLNNMTEHQLSNNTEPKNISTHPLSLWNKSLEDSIAELMKVNLTKLNRVDKNVDSVRDYNKTAEHHILILHCIIVLLLFVLMLGCFYIIYKKMKFLSSSETFCENIQLL